MAPETGPLFETTIWSTIRAAQAGHGTALNEVLLRYRPPVVQFFKRCGLSPEDAEDVAQDVLLALVDARVLDRADRSRGRFRNLLIAVCRNTLNKRRRERAALKRGGGRSGVSLHACAAPDERSCEGLLAAAENDESFDRSWVAHLLRLAMDRLKAEHADCFRVMDLYLTTDQSYEDIARALGKTKSIVDYHVRFAKQKLATYLRAEMASYSSSLEEYEEELRHLSAYLSMDR
ncbi:MAG: sigma-70 family RNA polymerase sigma factor [Planctomycetes bacterium]|nr:sigma-70 family RNA polymerase sigma factor [Planctomycetota bacterium]